MQKISQVFLLLRNWKAFLGMTFVWAEQALDRASRAAHVQGLRASWATLPDKIKTRQYSLKTRQYSQPSRESHQRVDLFVEIIRAGVRDFFYPDDRERKPHAAVDKMVRSLTIPERDEARKAPGAAMVRITHEPVVSCRAASSRPREVWRCSDDAT